MCKKIVFLAAVLSFCAVFGAFGEDELNKYAPGEAHFSAGFSVNERASDFGLGINLTSPYFFWDRVSGKGEWGNCLEQGKLGSSGVACRADKLPSSPLIVNGFAVTTGFRWYF